MHIIKSNNQYGYQEGVSTIGAIIKVGQYIKQTGNKGNTTNGSLKSIRRNRQNDIMDNIIQERDPGRYDKTHKERTSRGKL